MPPFLNITLQIYENVNIEREMQACTKRSIVPSSAYFDGGLPQVHQQEIIVNTSYVRTLCLYLRSPQNNRGHN